MEHVYRACDWITQWDKVDVDFVFAKLDEYNCEIALLAGDRDKQGNELLGIGVKAPSESSFQNLIQEVGHHYVATSWYPITEDEFNAGKRISSNKENRDHVYKAIQTLLADDAKSIELRHRLESDEADLQIFTIDWLIKRHPIPSVFDVFEMADAMEFPLAYARVEDSQGYLYLRFFAVVSSYETIRNFVKAIAGNMGLVEWIRVDKDKLPNVLRFNPVKSEPINLLSKWGEILFASAIHNEKLAERNAESGDE